jgi:hypothetical protein
VIVAHALTEATSMGATVGIDMLGVVAGAVASVTGDAAYDTGAVRRSEPRVQRPASDDRAWQA